MDWWWPAGAAGLGGLAFSARYTWWRWSKSGTPLLMYHHICDELNGSGLPNLRVRPASLARQLDFLKDRGYEALTLSQALAPEAPDRAVVLTFDDGYQNFYTQAWPLLKQRGMTATVFLVTGHLGGGNDWDQGKEPHEPLLNRKQILELAAQGVEFGGHGHHHHKLTGLDERGLMHEITGCQKTLTDVLGQPARVFSYAYGFHGPKAREAVLRAGFTAACTTQPGKLTPGSDAMELPRIIVKRNDDMLDFKLKLSRTRSRL